MLYTFVGNLADAPEVTTTPTDKTVAKLRLGVSESYRDAQGQWQNTETVWWNAEAWGSPAHAIIGAGLKKGQTVIVVGEIRSASWEADGEKKTRRFVSIRHIGGEIISEARRQSATKKPVEEDNPVDAAGEWAQDN